MARSSQKFLCHSELEYVQLRITQRGSTVRLQDKTCIHVVILFCLILTPRTPMAAEVRAGLWDSPTGHDVLGGSATVFDAVAASDTIADDAGAVTLARGSCFSVAATASPASHAANFDSTTHTL